MSEAQDTLIRGEVIDLVFTNSDNEKYPFKGVIKIKELSTNNIFDLHLMRNLSKASIYLGKYPDGSVLGKNVNITARYKLNQEQKRLEVSDNSQIVTGNGVPPAPKAYEGKKGGYSGADQAAITTAALLKMAVGMIPPGQFNMATISDIFNQLGQFYDQQYAVRKAKGSGDTAAKPPVNTPTPAVSPQPPVQAFVPPQAAPAPVSPGTVPTDLAHLQSAVAMALGQDAPSGGL